MLSSGLFRVNDKGETISYYSVKIKNDEKFSIVDIEIKPLDEAQSMTGLIMIVMKDTTKSHKEKSTENNKGISTHDVNELQNELSITKEQLQTAIEEFEISDEELKSANGELQSANEELQSTNEELETAKEELQ